MKLNYKQHLTVMKSTQEDCIAPSRKSKHINESERQQIEHWRLKGVSVAEIAMLLQRHRSTIYRELKRGTVIFSSGQKTRRNGLFVSKGGRQLNRHLFVDHE